MILLIGYGNSLRGDDGVGQHIARRLDVTLYREAVAIIACHQLTPELVEPISRADRVIFVDAAEGGEPGAILYREVQPRIEAGALTHHVSPEALLAAVGDLYGTHPKGFLMTIAGAQFEYSETLSPEVEAAVPEVLERIKQVIEAQSSP